MKKKLLILMILIAPLLLTGCEEQKKENNQKIEKREESTDKGSKEEIELYTDDSKIVYELGNTIYVFYYENQKITGYHTYMDYKTKEKAKEAYQTLNKEDYPTVQEIKVEGKYIVFKWGESEYNDMEISELKNNYSHMKERKR